MPNPEFRKIVMIGLGGSGQLIVTHLKRLFMDTYGMVPPSIRLLCLDTDVAPTSLRSAVSDKQYKLDQDEFLYLKVTDPADFIKSDETVRGWYAQQRVPVGSLIAGAGGVRQNGRLALFFHINEFMNRLDAVTAALGAVDLPKRMETAKEEGALTDFRLSEQASEVYVCGSLAGGTGSGTFLDVGIILRDALPNALIHGFFLLDWVYRNKPFTHRISGNVYAALSELDSLQSVVLAGASHVAYRMKYGTRRIEVKSPPYTLFNVIDGRNEYGQNVDDPAELCDIVANAIFLSVGSMGHAMTSVVDNLVAHVNASDPKLWNGRCARYSSFGVSSIYYPAREFQRLFGLQNALRLCQEAQTDVGGAAGRPKDREAVDRQLKDLDLLNRSTVKTGVCPFTSRAPFTVHPFQLSDPFPGQIQSAEQSAEKQLTMDLDGIHDDDGQRFFDNVATTLQQSINDIVNNPSLDAAFLRDWLDGMAVALDAARTIAVGERNEARIEVGRCREAMDQLLGAAQAAVHRPIVGRLMGNPRAQAVEEWRKAVARLLDAMRDARILEYEVGFYERVTALLKGAAPTVVPKPSEVLDALKQAEAELSSALAVEQENFKMLKGKPTHMLVANGNIVVIPSDGATVTKASVSGGATTAGGGDFLTLSLAGFKDEAGIHVGNDYLRYRKQGQLSGAFRDHAMKKLEPLGRVTVGRALASLDDQEHVKARFDDLFRKASALWSFRVASLNAEQKPQYAKIVNIGVYDAEEAKENYGDLIGEARVKHEVRAYSLTTTADPYRIWLLNYAAALPVTVLGELKERKRVYEEALTPPYHVDRFFEMNAPDLYPEGDDTTALRLLGMAIVSGIDVVKDDKLTKGHRFTFDTPEIREKNFDDPLVWYLFRDMYAAVREDQNLRQTLSDVLSRRVAALMAANREQVKNDIRTHLDKYLKRVADRDFSRLVSARLTYREGKELEKFLDPRGYAMDINRYVHGR